jgi:uncharacterized lipoprotein YmbA
MRLRLRTSLATLTAAALVLLAACVSTPPVRLHTLMPAAPGPRSEPAARLPLPVVLEPVRVPVQVDQPQWLVRLPDDSLAVLEQERWASPLRDELRQAVLQELATRWGAVDPGGATAGAAVRVAIDVRRFDSIPGREARIEGSWSVRSAGDRSRAGSHCEWLFREAAGPGMPALAEAHRRAVVRLADALGASLLALGRGVAPSCPATDPV